MALPQQGVLRGECRDRLLPSEVEQQKGRPEEQELVARVIEVEQAAEGEGCDVVGQQVRNPQQPAEGAGPAALPHAWEEEEEDLQGEARQHQALDLPLVPQLLGTGQ